jgi:hypothetical protein
VDEDEEDQNRYKYSERRISALALSKVNDPVVEFKVKFSEEVSSEKCFVEYSRRDPVTFKCIDMITKHSGSENVPGLRFILPRRL